MASTTEKRDIREFILPAYNEIPDVGLYLKQVVKYINETLEPWFDIKVTETMLSNYVKMHMIPNAIKKQYYRDQIIAMMFTVLAKTVVSLDNIQLLLKIREEKYEAKDAYDYFRAFFMHTLGAMYGVEENQPEAKAEHAPEITLLNNVLIAIVQNYHIECSFRELARTRENVNP